MSLWRELKHGIRRLANRGSADKDAADELDHYLEEATSALEQQGLTPQLARRQASLDIGNLTNVKEHLHEYGWENAIETVVADLKYAIRRLLRNPGFSAICVLTLALGVGASTAIFSVVNPVLFRPLPYPNPGRLLMVWDGLGGARTEVTFGTYRELAERGRAFESIAVMKPLQVTLTGTSEPERISGQYVSANYFRVLSVPPALGRDFEESDDLPRAPVVAVISDRLWRRRFVADAAIIGRQILSEDAPVTVVGVMPAGFENALSPDADLWMPLQYDKSLPGVGREWGHHLRMLGRLRGETSLDEARQELKTIANNRVGSFPRQPQASLAQGFLADRLQDDLTRSVRPALFAIAGAVLLLLAIVCVNVTNLLLARGSERHAELALRSSLGASQSRLVRQLLVEALLLVALGGTLGAFLAQGVVKTVIALSPADLPRTGDISVDASALAFAVAITSLLGLVVGLVPACTVSRADPLKGIQQSSARSTSGHHWMRGTLVVAQVALAMILLVGASLLFRSMQRLLEVPPGFNPTRLLTMQVMTSGQRFRSPASTHQFFERILDEVRRVPGVSSAAFTSELPLTGDEDVWGVHFESTPAEAKDEKHDTYRYAVSPGYFEAMRIPLRAGRYLASSDVVGAPGAAVINESAAKRRLPGLNPIGQRLHIGPNVGSWYTVVGVVGDVKQTSLAIGWADGVYVTASQWERFADGARWLVVRTARDAEALAPTIRRVISSVDKDQPVLHVATMEERVRGSLVERRFALVLFEAFALVALVLAAIGVYGLLSGGVNERTRELGVRAALGASRATILSLVLRQGMALVGLGLIVGGAGAFIASQALAKLLFGTSPLDASAYLVVVLLFVAVSLLACGLPAWRAARISPSIALRA